MEKEDYLKRMLDQMGRALGKVLFNIISVPTDGKIMAGIMNAKQQLRSEAHLDIDELLAMDDQEMLDHLKKKSFNNSLIEQLAKIMYELGKRQTDAGERQKLYRRTRYILEYLNRSDKTYSTERQQILVGIESAENRGRT